MAFSIWNYKDHFRTLPPVKLIKAFGRKKWDSGIKYDTSATDPKSDKIIFTMPSFARHGRWGNMVFQYIFIRVLAKQYNGEIQLYRSGNYMNSRMGLYQDMQSIPNVQAKANTILLDSYHVFPRFLNFIPPFVWRALYLTTIRLQKCFLLDNIDEAVNSNGLLPNEPSIEVEGLFMFNPKFYLKQHKEYILRNILQPTPQFQSLIDDCIQAFGTEKTIIGIHIRRGDYLRQPLGNFAQYPLPVKYITSWLTANIASIKNPAIYVCSDDQQAYKEIEQAGFEVFTTKKLLSNNDAFAAYEQLDWEILRRCAILITSNSSFSFSSAFLSIKSPECYQFSVPHKKYISFNPWTSEPLQSSFSSPYLGGYLYSRFALVRQMVSTKAAFLRLLKDLKNWLFLVFTKPLYLYYTYGITLKFFTSLFNIFELFQLYPKADSTNTIYNISSDRIDRDSNSGVSEKQPGR